MNRHSISLLDCIVEQTDEVEAVRMAHSRRLARLKSILTSYRLVKRQLQLYEDDYIWSVVIVAFY